VAENKVSDVIAVCSECGYPCPDFTVNDLAPFHLRGDGTKCLGINKEMIKVTPIVVRPKHSFTTFRFQGFYRGV